LFDVLALGELLIDFTPHGISENGNVLFERNPGGAPANVLATLSRLGAKTAFIGKVGRDAFGTFLDDTLKKNGIDTSGLQFSDRVNTTLAFVQLTQAGDRSFSFYRDPGADTELEEAEISEDLIRSAKIFHFGSLSLTNEPSRSATYKALDIAKRNGLMVSYDPNLRPSLWKSLKEAADMIKSGLPYADIIKLSEEELEFITGEKDLVKGSEMLEDMGIKLILVTLGPKGTFYRHSGATGQLCTYDTKIVDTTGAGDAFLGAALYRLRGMSPAELPGLGRAEIESLVDFANAAGALAASKKGAISAVPEMREIDVCMKTVPKLI
jgi:fructokinase